MESFCRQHQDLVSVIIPIRRGEDVSKTVRSIENSTYKETEIIIVDEMLERSEQRNIGIKRAKGKYLLFLDSDQSASPALIGECVSKLNSTDVMASLYIPEKIIANGFFGAIRRWERKFYTGTPVDCVRFVAAVCCPFFDQRLTGPEDADWNHRVPFVKGVTHFCLYHHDNISLIKYLKKKAYYAKSMSKYAELWPNDPVLNWKWRCFGVFFENGKWRKFLARPHFALAVWALILIRGVIYLLTTKAD